MSARKKAARPRVSATSTKPPPSAVRPPHRVVPTALEMLVDVSNEIHDLVQDFETVQMAIVGAANDESFDIAGVACTAQRLTSRLAAVLAKVDEAREMAKEVAK